MVPTTTVTAAAGIEMISEIREMVRFLLLVFHRGKQIL
jgi:hypothetical protein